jgi:hypothetical protein
MHVGDDGAAAAIKDASRDVPTCMRVILSVADWNLSNTRAMSATPVAFMHTDQQHMPAGQENS